MNESEGVVKMNVMVKVTVKGKDMAKVKVKEKLMVKLEVPINVKLR